MDKGKSSEFEPKLAKHYAEFDTFLKKSKIVFNKRYDGKFSPNGTLNDFQRIKTLGTGSFGRVMLVVHKQSKKPFALKIMEKSHVVRLKQVQHTLSEIRILDAVKFEFLVSMDFFFKDNVYLYLAMPFVNGGEMFSHLRLMNKFEEPLSKFYAAQVIMCFEYLHYIGIIYRDLKPENILIDREGYLKVTDLGFCKKIDTIRTYTLCGTPEYLAPEIILSKGYNYAVDWWALGVLIYEMAAGYPPFYARDPMRTYEKIVTGKYTCPGHFTRQLKELLSHMLEVDRSKRFGILKNGAKDIKGHEWFKSVDWDNIFARKAKPPFVPNVHSDQDTSNFDFYEEKDLRYASIEEYAEEFRNIEVTKHYSERHIAGDFDDS